jgi:hypothetical protein
MFAVVLPASHAADLARAKAGMRRLDKMWKDAAKLRASIDRKIVLASILAAPSGPLAQGRGGGRGAPAAPDTRPFDPHDLSGFWTRNEGDRSIRGSKMADVPPMTPEGERLLNANIPARGRPKGSPLNGDHPAYVRAVIPADSNDPIMQCNPQGLPRLILDTEPTEWIQLPGRLIQFFQWGHIPREIWMEGASCPLVRTLSTWACPGSACRSASGRATHWSSTPWDSTTGALGVRQKGLAKDARGSGELFRMEGLFRISRRHLCAGRRSRQFQQADPRSGRPRLRSMTECTPARDIPVDACDASISHRIDEPPEGLALIRSSDDVVERAGALCQNAAAAASCSDCRRTLLRGALRKTSSLPSTRRRSTNVYRTRQVAL